MKLVGLISDTHGRLPDAALGAWRIATISSCGRHLRPRHFARTADHGAYTAVLGNNDYDEYGKNVTRFAHPVIDGVRFLVAHYPTMPASVSTAREPSRRGIRCRRCACTGIPTSPRFSPVATRTRPACSSAREAAAARAAGSGVGRLHRAGSGTRASRPRGIARRRSAVGDGEVERKRPPWWAAFAIRLPAA